MSFRSRTRRSSVNTKRRSPLPLRRGGGARAGIQFGGAARGLRGLIRSQHIEGWVLARTRCDDGGFSGGNIEGPALQCLLADIGTGRVDIVVVYKVDRLTRSLADFARLVEIFDAQSVS